ncbi:MAG: AI-2E family transporter [Lachnospiraceae bacterium]|nr:AI-2E family transporter [Lachnospiraceae bacterium]
MDLNKGNMKKIRGLILFTAVVCLAVVKLDVLLEGIFFLLSIVRPFIYGAAIAFVLNIPMKAIEKSLFSKAKNPKVEKVKRPASIFLAFAAVVLVIVFVTVTVVPQVTKTMIELGNKIPKFLADVQIWLEELFASQPQLIALLEEFDPAETNWDSIVDTVIDFLQNGLGSVVSSTVTVASTIIGGVVNLFVALVFSFYILSQKEKLGSQFRRILHAYFPQKVYDKVLEVTSLAGRNFSSFITGQCMEAVILGTMFVITMALFGFPYAVMVGVLIAFTALIPIVGAFIGCFVGAFLIMVDDPVKAIWFLVLFIVLQQIEGNLIYPHVVGNSVGLPSIWVLAAVTIGGSLMGVVGMLIFIPILSTVYALLREDVNERNGKKRKNV